MPDERMLDMIRPSLFLGDIHVARRARAMKDRGITHILSVCTNVIPPSSTEYPFVQARLSVEDADDANIILALSAACQWIYHVLNSGGVVLVHSHNGHSRAAAVVAAYLMLTERMSSTMAQHSIRCVRDLIWIRPILVEQLVLFEVCQHQPHENHPVYRAWCERMLLQPAAALVFSES